MAKIAAQDIKDLGFTREMFSVIASDDSAFNALVDAVIAEQSLELEGRIGSARYDDATAPNATYVKLAEKYLAAAEMLQRRINLNLGNTQGAGQEIKTDNEHRQRKAYLEKVFGNPKADPPVIGLIEKIVAGSGTDSEEFSSGSLVTTHFEATGV